MLSSRWRYSWLEGSVPWTARDRPKRVASRITVHEATSVQQPHERYASKEPRDESQRDRCPADGPEQALGDYNG